MEGKFKDIFDEKMHILKDPDASNHFNKENSSFKIKKIRNEKEAEIILLNEIFF